MRKVLFVGVIGLGLWYFFFAGKVDEGDVRGLYEAYWAGLMNGDGKAICDLFHDDFNGVVRTRGPNGPVQETSDRAAICDSTGEFFAMKKALEEKAGTEMVFNVDYTLHDITIGPDGKSATARMVSEIRIGTAQRRFLRVAETQTDTIVGGLRGAKFLSSEGDVSLR